MMASIEKRTVTPKAISKPKIDTARMRSDAKARTTHDKDTRSKLRQKRQDEIALAQDSLKKKYKDMRYVPGTGPMELTGDKTEKEVMERKYFNDLYSKFFPGLTKTYSKEMSELPKGYSPRPTYTTGGSTGYDEAGMSR